MKKKILAGCLLLLCVGVLASCVSAVSARRLWGVSPVHVKWVKDVCYVRVRGAHHGGEKVGYGVLWLTYRNLMKGVLKGQTVKVEWSPPYGGGSKSFMALPHGVGDFLDHKGTYYLAPAPIGVTFDFEINVYYGYVHLATISGSVFIPPP